LSKVAWLRFVLALVDAKTILEIKRIFDIASVLSEAAKRANLSLEKVNDVQLTRLEAEIKLGHELIRTKRDHELTSGPKKQLLVGKEQRKRDPREREGSLRNRHCLRSCADWTSAPKKTLSSKSFGHNLYRLPMGSST
jgi:hypothetical protein